MFFKVLAVHVFTAEGSFIGSVATIDNTIASGCSIDAFNAIGACPCISWTS